MKYPFTRFLPLFLVVSQKIKVVLVLAMIAIACVVPALAEDVSTDDESEMAEIVVTATRYGKDVKEIPANVTVITEKDIKNSTAQNVADLMRGYVGVKVNDIGGSRRKYTVDLRGFGETAGSNTLVLVDGRRVNQADLSGVDWTQIPIDRVERIEIVRGGSGSVLYGDNASGGTVNIITKMGDKFKAGIEGSKGSYDAYSSNAYIRGSLRGLLYSFTASYLESDGYRDNSETLSRDAGLNLDYYFGDFLKLGLSSGYHKDKTGLPGALFESDFKAGLSRTDTTTPDDFSQIKDYYVQVVPEVSLGDNFNIKVDGSFRNRDSKSFFSSSFGTFEGDTEIDTVSVSPKILLKSGMNSINNVLTIGFDYQNAEENLENNSSISGIAKFELRKKSYGYYIYDDLDIADTFSLSAGYRYDKAEYEFDPGIPDSTSEDERAYSIGLNYIFYKNSYVYLNYAKSFRYPLLDEFFNFFTNTVDESLTSQESDDYEIGIRYYLSKDIYGQINYFWINTDDEIFFNPVTFTNENLDGDTRRKGVEVSFNADATQWIAFNGSYTYMDTEIKDGQFEGNEIPDVPYHKATVGTSITWKDVSFALNGIYIGERLFISDFSNEFGDQDDYFVLNSRIKYKWKTLTAFLDINNVDDKHYSEYGAIGFNVSTFQNEKAFYPSPERNFLFGVSVDL